MNLSEGNPGQVVRVENRIDLNGTNRTVACYSTKTLSSYVNNNNGYMLSAGGRLTGVIRNTGGTAAGLIKIGPGDLQLTAASTYDGATAVSNGTLSIYSGNNRLPTSTTVTLGDSATDDSATFALRGQSQQLAGLLTTGNGTANRVISDRHPSLSSQEGTLVLNIASGTNTFTGTLGGSTTAEDFFGLTKQGSGRLTLTAANSYSGLSTISAGVLEISGAGTLGDGSYSTNMVNNGVFHYNSSTDLTMGGVISGTGDLRKEGSSTLTLSATNTYTGDTIISNGTFRVTVTDAVATTPTIRLGPSGSLNAASLATYEMPAGTTYVFENSGTSSGSITADELDISNADVTISNKPSGGVVLATYTSLTGGAFASTNGVPAGWTINYAFNGSQIVLLPPLAVPEVSNNGSTNLSETSASISGLLTTGSWASAWFCWGTNDAGRADTGLWDNVVSANDVMQGTPFSTTVTGLETNRTYWYRCYVSNSMGVAWSHPGEVFNGTAVGGSSDYSLQITFTNFAGKGTLTNFPALVRFTTNNIENYEGFISSSGWDLRFWTNSSLSGTELNYEIELFDTNSNSYVWVLLPELTNNLSIWASWGNSSATNQQTYTTNGAVWSNGYLGVWHMKESGNAPADSALIGAGDNSGTDAGTDATVVTGKIGDAYDYSGNGRVDISNSSNLDSLANGTISFWYYKRSRGGSGSGANYGSILGQSSGYNWAIRHANNDRFELRVNGTYLTCQGDLANSDWHYLTYVFDDAANEWHTYRNGVLINSPSTTQSWLNPDHLIGDCQHGCTRSGWHYG